MKRLKSDDQTLSSAIFSRPRGTGRTRTETVTYHQQGNRAAHWLTRRNDKGEGMEESGNEGLDDLVRREGGCFDGVECVCIVSQFLIL